MNIAAEITRRIRFTGIVAVMVLVSVTAAQASLLVDFLPQPASEDMPEFIWDGSSLTTGPGAYGGGATPGVGDGDDGPELQPPPGLHIVTPFVIDSPTPPGGVVDVVAGSTTFYDVTLDITVPLTAAGAPDTLYDVYVVQNLTGGAFELLSTDPGLTTDPTLLLAGTVETAAIAGILNSDTGAVLSATISYTGGVIYDAALEYYGASSLTGSFSWSLLDIDLPLSVVEGTPAPDDDYLNEFEANGTGQFSGTPEPATLVLLLGGSCVVAMRRRRRG